MEEIKKFLVRLAPAERDAQLNGSGIEPAGVVDEGAIGQETVQGVGSK